MSSPETCTTCGGTSFVGGEMCPACFGTGTLPLKGALAQGSLVLDKLNSIIAEQASQREDLTTALTQIWNKVKDL